MTEIEKNQAAKDHGALAINLGNRFWTTYKEIMDRDDFIGEAYFAMAKALNSFEIGRGRKLSSYIHLCIANHLSQVVSNYKRKKRHDKDIEIVSLDKDIDGYGNLHDVIPSKYQPEHDILDNLEFDYLTHQLTDDERELLDWVIEGLPLSDYAAMLGVDRRTVHNHREKLRKKLNILLDRKE